MKLSDLRKQAVSGIEPKPSFRGKFKFGDREFDFSIKADVSALSKKLEEWTERLKERRVVNPERLTPLSVGAYNGIYDRYVKRLAKEAGIPSCEP